MAPSRRFLLVILALICATAAWTGAEPDTQPATRPAYLPVDVQKTIHGDKKPIEIQAVLAARNDS